MTAFVDLDSIHVPSTGVAIPTAWGLQVNANFDHFNELELLTCTSGTRPGSPVTNKLIRETDTTQLLVYDGSAWVPFAQLGAWTNFTPSVAQSVTITKTVTFARYIKLGRLVIFEMYVSLTSNGTANNAFQVAPPVTAVQNSLPIGTFYWYDASAGKNYTAHAFFSTTTAVAGLISDSAVVLGQTATADGITYPNQAQSGDSLLVRGMYESAT